MACHRSLRTPTTTQSPANTIEEVADDTARAAMNVLTDVVQDELQAADSLLATPDSVALSGTHPDALSADSLLTDSALVKEKILTVDSVMRSTSVDSMMQMIASGRTMEVMADTTRRDTVRQDTLRRSKSALDAPVQFEAKDSITFDYINRHANFYGDAKLSYQNFELQAAYITLSLDSSIVHAMSRTDTTKNEVIGRPVFKQGDETYEPDSISYNFKSRKAFISNVYTSQGDGVMISYESKRDSSGVMYIQKGKYTTCDADHPHFYLSLSRAKVRPGEDVVFGPAYLVVEDVPMPLAIPYGFFPFSKSYSSGFIMPTYGDETTRGFYVRDGGYYFALSDKIDAKVLGEIYTKGSWGVSLQTNYKKRYKYSGNFYFSYQNTKEGEKNMPDYSVSKSFKITWSHRTDAKANPTQTFSASVNFATSSFERNNLTSMYNPESLTQSTRTSSISYSKTVNSLGLTLSGTFNLSQNMRDSTLAITLPSLNISVNRFYPFKRKKAVGKERWYEKISMSYTGTLSNSITAKESEILHKSLVKDWKNAMKHNIPINASFTIADYINITPSFNFTDRMYTNKVLQSWDADRQTVKRDTVYGFYNDYNYNMSVSANTTLYGMYTPLPWAGGKKIEAIRHVFNPSVSFSYAPDFKSPRYGIYETYYKTDKDGNVSAEPVYYSPFQSGMYGTAPSAKTGSITLDVSNNVEMKIRTDKDTTGTKKVSLIDELGANLSYNLAAKDRPWSDLSTRVRLKLTKSYTFSLNAIFATYGYEFDDNGSVRPSNETEWSRGRFGRFQGMSQSFSYTFNNQTLKKWFGKQSEDDVNGKKKKNPRSNSDDEDDEDLDELDDDEEVDPEMQNVDPDRAKAKRGGKREKAETDEDGYTAFKLPWNLSLSYGVSMRENTSADINPRNMRYPYKLTHTLNASGNVSISENWTFQFSSGWDFNYNKLSMTTASVSRDLHCFSMQCSMVIAPYRSFNFTFQCKMSTLADLLKWKKQSSYSSNVEWY